jgi:hypothetical protein
MGENLQVLTEATGDNLDHSNQWVYLERVHRE